MIVVPLRAGMVGGMFFAFWQFMWSVLVASGLAQPLLDLLVWAQFFDVSAALQPFQLERALLLVTIWLLGGFAIGFVAAISWNSLHVVTERKR